ncbi:MAG: HEAT repeat domain-containing protein [Pirellulaceae bacterium]
MYSFRAAAEYRRLAIPHLPKLIELLEHPDNKVAAEARQMISMLGPAGRPATAALQRRLFDKKRDGLERLPDLIALVYITPENVPVTPLILPPADSLSNFSAEVQLNGRLTSLAMISEMYVGATFCDAGHTTIEVPFLTEALLKPYPTDYRAMAILLLARMGNEAKTALPTLEKLLDDEEIVVRITAAAAILHIQRDLNRIEELADRTRMAKSMRDAFVERWQEDSEERFLSAQQELRAHYPIGDGEEMIRYLVTAMQHGRGYYRRRALLAAAELGPAARDAVPTIRALLAHNDVETRRLAAAALKKISPNARKE